MLQERTQGCSRDMANVCRGPANKHYSPENDLFLLTIAHKHEQVASQHVEARLRQGWHRPPRLSHRVLGEECPCVRPTVCKLEILGFEQRQEYVPESVRLFRPFEACLDWFVSFSTSVLLLFLCRTYGKDQTVSQILKRITVVEYCTDAVADLSEPVVEQARCDSDF